MKEPSDSASDLAALTRKYEQLDRRFERLRAAAIELDDRLNRVENSLLFRTLRRAGRILAETRGRTGQALLRSPFHGLYRRFRGPQPDPYSRWIIARESVDRPEQLRNKSLAWSYQPLISVLVPVHRPRPEWLRAAIDSVINQTWSKWELCLSIDGADPTTELQIQEVAGDDRIRFTAAEKPAGISAALNRAGTLATGEYVAFLDHDDVLSPAALHYIAEALQHRDADVIYTDEDSLAPTGERIRPNFKPAWSPELLLSCMYMGHLLVVSRAAIDRAGWFRSEFDGAQDYDLALRLNENGARFRHVPRVLYHWRIHEGSTAAAAAAKPYAHEAGRRALSVSLDRRGERFRDVVDGPIPHTYRIRRTVQPEHGISFVIVSRNASLLGRCLESVAQTAAAIDHEYVIVHHQSGGNDRDMEAVLRRFKCSVVPYTAAFNFSAMNNAATQVARKAVLVFLNDDITALETGWAETLLAHAMRPCIGVAGAKLVYPSGAIQHAGIAVGIGEGAGHMARGTFRNDLWRWLELTRDVSAVTGACMAMRRDLFNELGGFDEQFPVNYNDVDLCLRARAAGYRIIVDPSVVLQHDEARTRVAGTSFSERELFHDRWHDVLNDPFYSPLLDRGGEAIALART
jgi:GT2 family glycosyltransferase